MGKGKFAGKMNKLNLTRFGKRQLILSALIILIAVAGYINLNYYGDDKAVPTTALVDDQAIKTGADSTSKSNEKKTDASKADYFTNARLEREKSRSESMDIYREIINNPNSNDEAKVKAQDDLAFCAKSIEDEATLENLIKSKGFKDVVVFISAGGANVVVKSDGLIPAQVAQIKNSIVEVAKISSQNIKITEIR